MGYEALIIDDEVHAVRGLQAGIRWEQLRIHKLHTAHSAKQAREIFANHTIDVMVCDIEMPQETGLELLAWVREHSPKTQTVFLTCHSDFSYARQAIHLGSFDYMLKPVDYEEMEETLAKVLDKIQKDRELEGAEAGYKRYVQLWESQRPVMLERFWQELVTQSVPSTHEAIRSHMQARGVHYPVNAMFLPVLVHVQQRHKTLSPREEKLMEYALRNAVEEKLLHQVRHAAVVSLPQTDQLLAIIPLSPEQLACRPEQAHTDCEFLIPQCRQFFYSDLCCYIGEPVAITSVARQVQHLQRLDRNNVTRTNAVLLLSDEREQATAAELPPLPVKDWAEWMKQGEKERLIADAKRYMGSCREQAIPIDARTLHRLYQDFMQLLFFVLHFKGFQAHDVFATNLLTDQPPKVLKSLHAMEEWMLYVIDVAMNRMHAEEGSMSVVDKVKRYVEEKIGELELGRDEIASVVYLNPDYLTRLFKKETGMSLSDYIQQQRIAYAKRLLRTTSRQVSDIATMAGYSNLSYFSTLFKKSVQLTPAEYRKQCSCLMQGSIEKSE
ncbi:two-component system response regulator YesN [Paenibacillus phyllosphaerae]|uniref:Two-component system response regulator YesN n=1 Tax=Paenibacillus phyllosphaerae TaxID=274593 RepID=A0A7W5FMC1_9BACL|nr:response regulator [Paenibacillus phyllosphaerae]MBB3110111.1 two-component system response regulator YesN [Paenibacillus phyllosphaerae]